MDFEIVSSAVRTILTITLKEEGRRERKNCIVRCFTICAAPTLNIHTSCTLARTDVCCEGSCSKVLRRQKNDGDWVILSMPLMRFCPREAIYVWTRGVFSLYFSSEEAEETDADAGSRTPQTELVCIDCTDSGLYCRGKLGLYARGGTELSYIYSTCIDPARHKRLDETSKSSRDGTIEMLLLHYNSLI